MSSSKSKSSSSSTNVQETTNVDNRVGAEGGAIAIGQGGSLVFNDEFSPEVAEFADSVLEVLGDTLTGAASIVESANKTSTNAVQTIAAREQSGDLLFQDIIKNLQPVALIAGLAFVGVAYFKRKRK